MADRNEDEGVSGKLARVDADHVAPLNALARRWRGTGGGRFVPWFDPDDGGVDAHVLLLLERPAPSTVRAGEQAFSSEDNASATSLILRRARLDAGLDRRAMVRWNIVPWADPDVDGGRLRGARRADDDALDAALPSLHELLVALPRLTAVVTLGAPALTGIMRYLTLATDPVIRPVLAAPHPSPANTRRRAETYTRIVNALQRADRCAATGSRETARRVR